MGSEMYGPGKTWTTKAKFYAWLRGGLRRSLWNRSPIKIEFLKKMRFRAPLGRNEKEVWAMQCAICSKIFKQSECEVDHLEGNMSFKCEEDILPFIKHLAFVNEDDLQIVCKADHKIKSYAERYGYTFEEARVRKAEIAKKKEEALKRKKARKK